MQAIHPPWNWGRLVLLGGASFAVSWGFGLGFPLIYWLESAPSAYPWTCGLFFSALTAGMLLLCLDNPHQRRAAFTAFGLSALLIGPGYVANAERLAQFAPASAPWAAPHLPIWLTVLCWALSGGLVIWWLRWSRPGITPVLLFFGLLLVLLIMPWVSNRLGIESMRIVANMPMSADDHRQSKDALTHFLVQGEVSMLGDVCGFIIQTVGLTGSALTLAFAGVVVWAGWTRNDSQPFPNRTDLWALLLFLLGGLLFPFSFSLLDNMAHKFKDVEQSMGRHIYPYHAGLFSVEMLAGVAFLLGSWLVLRRIYLAPQLRFGFTVLVLIASVLLSVALLLSSYHVTQIIGVAALGLCVAQITLFFQAKRRARWIASVYANPGQTALGFVIQGSVMLAVLAGAFMAVAIELAFISVFGIHYFIAWGTALKPLHGVAPTEQIVPGMIPSLASIQVFLGPVYFSTCLFVSVMAVLLFSLVYWGCQGCARLWRWLARR